MGTVSSKLKYCLGRAHTLLFPKKPQTPWTHKDYSTMDHQPVQTHQVGQQQPLPSAKPLVPGNPLLCCVCDQYFQEPCLLQCYHTFCKRCLIPRLFEGRIQCPMCGQHTTVKDGVAGLQTDGLMKELIELANTENPPCANCDRRDRNNMYYCVTCGQALCGHCRENTHRAKMFSTHEVVHTSKCATEAKRCPTHGEHYIMFCAPQRTMLCVNCFRDAPAEKRTHCVDIDTAYNQSRKRLEEAQSGIIELQACVRESVMLFKNLLEEVTANMEEEKQIINTFCHGMQESIEKTHAAMAMEVQRQFETKQRMFLGQLTSVSTVMPILQLHLMLSVNFSATANKFQFLELVYAMFERLAIVARLGNVQRPKHTSTIRTNYRNEFAHSLEPWIGKMLKEPCKDYETKPVQPAATTASIIKSMKSAMPAGEGPFTNHCQQFNSILKEFSKQLYEVKEQINALHRDVSIIRRTHTPPLGVRYDCIARDCALLDKSLEKHQGDLEKSKVIFEGIWEEQLCRIQTEKEIFHDQITEILSLRNEVKQLSGVAQKLEPYIKSFLGEGGPGSQATTMAAEATQQHIKNLLEHIELMNIDSMMVSDCKLHPATSMTSVGRGRFNTATSDSMSDTNPYAESKRNVISQIIHKVKTKEDRRKSPNRAEDRMYDQESKPSGDSSKGKSGDDASCRNSISTVVERFSVAEQEKLEELLRKSAIEKVQAALRGKVDLTELSKELLSKKSVSVSSSRSNLLCKKQSLGDPATAPKHKDLKKMHKSYEKLNEKKIVKAEVIAHRDPEGYKDKSQTPRSATPNAGRKQKESQLKKDRRALSDSLLRSLNLDAITLESEPRKESDYQRISDATSSRRSASISVTPSTKSREQSPASVKQVKRKVYPYSDSEDVKYYPRKDESIESLSTESITSARPFTPEKAFFVVYGTRKSGKNGATQKQRAWETFPPKRRPCKGRNGNGKIRTHQYIKTKDLRPAPKSAQVYTSEEDSDKRLVFGAHYKDTLNLKDSFDASLNLRKTDSFEGHEEAVRSLLAAVHETRAQNAARKQRNT